MNWLSLLPTVVSAVSTIKSIIDIANSNSDIVSKIKQEVPLWAAALEEYGGTFFPHVKPELHVAAAAMSVFDPNVTKWLQGSLNVLVTPSPNLAVDGLYGPKTRAAVVALQTKLGLTIDEWAGQLTQAAISALLAKTPAIAGA